jgi:hypothetical protein
MALLGAGETGETWLGRYGGYVLRCRKVEDAAAAPCSLSLAMARAHYTFDLVAYI